ncbi:unnamed protein product [Didymodactylos carnosus]|uniref:Mitochondrial ribosomal protein S28 n=1 Tax=Didymodactylos carnosus TaxID=1234261 RepID=A0A814EUI6_9BILA
MLPNRLSFLLSSYAKKTCLFNSIRTIKQSTDKNKNRSTSEQTLDNQKYSKRRVSLPPSPTTTKMDMFNDILESFTKSSSEKSSSQSSSPLSSHDSSSTSSEPQTFAKLFRNSEFVQLGGIKGRLLTGRIFDVVDDDLYIDFGGKFHCVCQRPQSKNRDQFITGALVSIKLNDFEMASRFLGAKKHISLLEADAQLIAIIRKPHSAHQTRERDRDERAQQQQQQLDF